ncbi:hypothetical protein F4604DRAFT_1577788, partial [Suillus subluteus]
LRLHSEFGAICNPFAQPHGGCHSLTTGDLNYIESLLPANPCLYLDKLQNWLSIYELQ